MPFMKNPHPCKKCNKPQQVTRLKWQSANNKYYLLTTCKTCEAKITSEHQKNNRERWLAYNMRSYFKKNGPRKRRSRLEMTDELRKEWAREKAVKRATRAKQARAGWDKELTDFVTIEARKLCQLREIHTNFTWHTDHIVPLKGKIVCGLHVWNNLAVIPKVENLRKGNHYPFYEKRAA